jgi:uncharacterized membrane protein YgcG
VTDQTGTLSSSRPQIDAALEGLFQRTGVQLYVLFVHTTGGMDIAGYAYEVGQQSLSARDALLVVATDDRTDNISVGADLLPRVSQTSLDRVRSNVLEAGLASGDFGGAVVATADALGDVFPQTVPTGGATSGPTAQPTPVETAPPGPSEGSSGAGSFLILLLAGLLIAVGAAILIGRVVRLRTERRALFEEAKTQEQLGRQANALLLETDDALRDADQELGFAEAEFGAAEVKQLKDALARAREDLNAAFLIGQKLDDAEPETAEQRRQMIQDVITKAQQAHATADQQAAALGRLRDMEKKAPEALDRLDGQVRVVESSVDKARADQDRLARYAETSTAAVATNIDSATSKIAQARELLRDGREQLAAKQMAKAAIAAKGAEDLLTDAAVLLAAVTNLADALDLAAAELKDQLAHASNDVEAAAAQIAAGPSVPALTASLTDAQSASPTHPGRTCSRRRATRQTPTRSPTSCSPGFARRRTSASAPSQMLTGRSPLPALTSRAPAITSTAIAAPGRSAASHAIAWQRRSAA